MSKRKTVIIRIAYIAAFIIIMYFANRLLRLKTMHGSSQGTGMYLQPKNTVDVLFLGSSHMHTDVNPAVLWENEGIASYVFSAAEQPLWVTYYYLLEACKYQSPKLVVVDMYSPAEFGDWFNTEYWLGENFYNIRFSINKIRMIVETCTKDEIEMFFPSFFGYHSRYDSLTKEDFDAVIPKKEDKDFKGFTPYFKVSDKAMESESTDERGILAPKSNFYLNKIVDYTKENNIQLFLVVNPYPTELEDEMIFNDIAKIAEEDNVFFVDMNHFTQYIGIDNATDYSDESHLNYWGSLKFTTFLATVLKTNFEIPDRRGDPRYISWERNAEADKKRRAAETAENEYGRVLFIGDSRTIDMFADSDEDIFNEVHNDIAVYGGHGLGLDFMKEAVNDYGIDNFDTLVSWMGANEDGNFDGYGQFYEDLMSRGKKIVVCTVGPTEDGYLHSGDEDHYQNATMLRFNRSLSQWADSNNVRVIDLYKFISESDGVTVDHGDGIHYLPRPTTALWRYIVEALRSGEAE